MAQNVSRLSSAGLHVGRPAAAPNYLETAREFIGNVRNQFIIIVLLPTILASIYYGLIASRQYVSHTSYIVRGVDSHHAGGLSALLNTFGVSRAADETSAIETFLKSRDMIAKLNTRVNLRAIYSTGAADWLSRYPRPWQADTFENLYTFMQNFIFVTQDPSTGVTALDISSFDMASAREIADNTLELAGEMANSLNKSAQADTVGLAKKEETAALDNVVATQKDLTDFRNRELLVDPLLFAGEVLKGIAKLSLDQSETQTQIGESERLSPTIPSISAMKAKQEALESKIEEERARLAGNNSALATKMGSFDRITLLRDLAEKRYSSALLSLQAAEADAQRKRVYIENIVQPNTPDDDTLPERFRSALSVFVVTFMGFSILWILSVGSKDHAQ